MSLFYCLCNLKAHGIWFAERAKQTALIYGVGADDLEMVKRLPLIEKMSAYDAHLNTVDASLVASGPIVLAMSDEHPSVYSAVMNNGVWSKTPDGKWHQKGKDEVPNAVVAERTIKYAVHVKENTAKPVSALPDQTLQIVPVTHPLPKMMGDVLELKVLFNGKPAAGVEIKSDYVNDPDGPALFSDEDGRVFLRVRNQGLNVIAAIFDAPADDPKKVNKVEHLGHTLVRTGT